MRVCRKSIGKIVAFIMGLALLANSTIVANAVYTPYWTSLNNDSSMTCLDAAEEDNYGKKVYVEQPVPYEYTEFILGMTGASEVVINVPEGTGISNAQRRVWNNNKWSVNETNRRVLEGNEQGNSSYDTSGLHTAEGYGQTSLIAAYNNASTKEKVCGNYSVLYKKLGVIKDSVTGEEKNVNVKMTVTDYVSRDSDKTKPPVIGLCIDDGFPGVTVTNVLYVTVKYDFLDDDGNLLYVKGSTSYYDVDWYQAVHLTDKSKDVFVTDDCVLYISDVTGEPGHAVYYKGDVGTSDFTTTTAFTETFEGNGMIRTFSFQDQDNDGDGGIFHTGTPVVRFPGNLVIEKKVESNIDLDEEYTFTVTFNEEVETTYQYEDGEPIEFKGTELEITLKDGESVQINELGESLIYTIVEENHDKYDVDISHAAVDLEGNPVTVTTLVSDNATATYKGAIVGNTTNTVTYENAYEAAPVKVQIDGTKTLEGRDLKADEFTFVLKDGNNVLERVQNGADGTFAFTEMEYDNVGTHEYTVFEELESIGGVTFDESVYTVEVEVTDGQAGNLVADVTYKKNGEEAEAISFTNSYAAKDVSVAFSGTKTLEGRELKAGEFAFELKEDGATLDTAENDNTGEFTFDAITFDKAGTYTYTVTEQSGQAGGVTYDTTVCTITVVVTDNLNGQLEADVTYKVDGEAKDSITFTNTYTAEPVQVVIEGNKVLTGRELAEDEFSFKLTDNDSYNDVVMNKADGTFAFREITFDKAGTYTYSVVEQEGTLCGVTYDKTIYTVTVEVTDNGVGNLVADVEYAAAGAEKDGITFTNAYKAAPVEVVIDGNKELTGRKLAADEFTFELKMKGETIDSVSNDAEGRFVFETLTFEEVGEYEYEVSELKETLGGVTYDETVYTVAVKVTDNGAGNLEAAVSYKQNGEAVDVITFTNTYDVAPATLVIEAEKVLKGRELKADEFTFVLETEAGEKLYATNTESGKIVFEELVYEEAGVYTYKLYEQTGELDNVTYDKSIYTITVTVTDDLEGKLVAKAAHSGEKLAFENVYTEPVVATGDNARITLWLALAGMAMLTILIEVRRRFS